MTARKAPSAIVLTIEIIQTDITTLRVDVIVNAANEGLRGGSGVDGAIHRAAGPRLLEACRAIPETRPGVRCPTGEARITPGFDLPARFVIHTVGPVWRGGDRDEPALLAACHRNVLVLAREHAVDSIAFPAISCGVYGYPRDAAAGVALSVLAEEEHRLRTPHRIVLCAFDRGMAEVWRRAAERLHVSIAID
ncbi:MAG: O-acetyl-ADP-ribose deacetylase [Rhodanobacteraceae bacterium]|jgi:O-acetyl-ADP-ribose deacetylase (regulator of RNase III)|nr:MAG: O-acetyl-ADP-ribose deacetylase [Rhodanobacteraceae bacterium]